MRATSSPLLSLLPLLATLSLAPTEANAFVNLNLAVHAKLPAALALFSFRATSSTCDDICNTWWNETVACEGDQASSECVTSYCSVSSRECARVPRGMGGGSCHGNRE